MNEWNISTQYIDGEKYYQIYRPTNPNEVDHTGNREYYNSGPFKGLYRSESLAKEDCDRLNRLLKEDKAVSTQKLFEYMKTCRQFEDLEKLEYVIEDSGEEFVIGTFKDGYKKRAYVTGDSCLALGMDTLRLLGY